jgi:phospholipid/cholesterol/gamma-HCH transport system ATP-binding protein
MDAAARIAAAPQPLAQAYPPPHEAALVRAEGLCMAFGETVVQRDLSFEVHAGEAFVIAGGSGCGKSLLLRHLMGLQVPAAGRVLHRGQDLYAADAATLAALRRGFGVTFQAGALWSSMTVGENVMLPLQLCSTRDAASREQEARFKLALVGLAGSFDAAPEAMSGGMVKRAAIARALALDPPLLFLDEPGAGLDPPNATHIDELLMHLRDDLGTTVVMVSHDLGSIVAVADRVLFLDAERHTMTALGPPRELMTHGEPAVRAFLQRGAQRPAAR